jgi:predicted permease
VGGPNRVANLDRRQDHWYQVKARLAPGVTVEQARAAMRTAALRMGEQNPAIDRGRGITVFAFDEVRFHPEADRGLLGINIGLLVVAGLVLLLTCANLANLLLVRGISRSGEIAVREALGAGRSRVMRLLLLEALILACLGGAGGLTIGAWAMQVLPTLPIPTPGGTLDTGFDARVLTFGVVLTLLTGVVFGLLPAARTTRTDIASQLRDEGRGRSPGRRSSLLRGTLVAVQVAVSTVLVIGAGLLVRSLANAQDVDAGFDVDRIAVVGTNLPQGGVARGELDVVSAQLVDRVRALPGVAAAALTTRLPVTSGGTTTQMIEGHQTADGTGAVELPLAYVSRGYFETMGIPVVEGRAFSPEDHRGAPRVVMVNEAAARRYWRGNAVGGRIRSPDAGDDGWVRVIGVVGDTKVSRLQEPPTPMIFYSADQATIGVFSIAVRTTGDPAALIGGLRQALRDVRATLPVTRLMTMETHLGAALAQPRLAALLLSGFSVLGLLLASLGVYAVVSFAVERRTQELGIRAALGASAGRIMRLVISESLVMVGIGLGAGLMLAVVAARGLRGMLFQVGAGDAVTFIVAATLLLTAAGVAAFLPARRAARADPVDTLRAT